MPKRFLLIIVSTMVGLAVIALWLGRDDKANMPSGGKSATAIHETVISPGAVYSAKFTDLEGKEWVLGHWDRKLLIINFWATWCGPCKEEIPILIKIQTRFADQGVQLVGIAADSRINVANFAQNIKVNYPLLPDEAGAIELSKRLGNRLGLLPHTVVFEPGGAVIYNKLGAITEGELSDIVLKNIPIKP